MLSDLTGRLVDVMSRLGPDPWAAHPDAHTPADPVAATGPDLALRTDTVTSTGLAPTYDGPAHAPPQDEPPVQESPSYASAPTTGVADPVPQSAAYAPPPSEAPLDLPPPVIADIVPRTSVAPAPAAAYVARSADHAAPVATEQLAPAASAEAEAALDDETVLRLRLIRESFGR